MKLNAAFALLMALYALPCFAGYDPKPSETLSVAQGEWAGSLTYRDYREPHKLVTLPTRLFVALSSPNEIVLHYVYDDGPSKTVFSYEKMRFDSTKKQVVWVSGVTNPEVSISNITADVVSNSNRSVSFERVADGVTKKYQLEISASTWTLSEDEVGADGVSTFRNKYMFKRPGT